MAAGINYTLRNQENPDANVYTQSIEIKEAVPKVIEEAEKHGCLINEMAVAGGSAGHTLAMLYAYRDADSSPVPVRLLFGAVGPSGFYTEDWDIYGFDKNTEESQRGGSGAVRRDGRRKINPGNDKRRFIYRKIKTCLSSYVDT